MYSSKTMTACLSYNLYVQTHIYYAYLTIHHNKIISKVFQKLKISYYLSQIHISIHTQAYIYTYIYIHTHTHTYIYI